MCLILIVDFQTSIKQLGCANTYFKYCMTNKIQYEAVVIHESLQEMIFCKAHHLTFLFFLVKNVQKAYLNDIGMHNRRI